ncbi:MAG: hypothetical protein ACE5G7_00525, partial [Candidatus Hydrothermarchaeaceae archaeon]
EETKASEMKIVRDFAVGIKNYLVLGINRWFDCALVCFSFWCGELTERLRVRKFFKIYFY